MAVRGPERATLRVRRMVMPDPASPGMRTPGAAPARVSATGRRARQGQSLVEFALILPVLLLLLLAAIDFGRLFFSYVQVSNAAREGAGFAAANPTDTAGIGARALQEASVQGQRGESAVIVTASCANAAGTTISCADAPGGSGTGNTVTVRAAEAFTFFTPLINGFFGNSVQVAASASSSVLGLAAGGGGTTSVCASLPVASFTVTNVGTHGVTLNANASTPTSGACAISGYNWDMGDGLNPFPPIVGNPATYDYASDGTFTITLQVTNSAGSATTSQSVTVGATPTPSPTPTIAPTPTPTVAPTATPTTPPSCSFVPTFTSQFTGNGNGAKAHQESFQGAYTGLPAPTTWSWTFGDTTTGSSQNTSRNYADAGTYTVVLTIRNGTCSQTVSHDVTVP